MKLKKLALNAIAMEYSEMKQIKAGASEDDILCFLDSSKTGCVSNIGIDCRTGNASGKCAILEKEIEGTNGELYASKCYCNTSN